MPAKYLYDDLGSVLFEAITYVPEYGLTNADIRVLRDNADAIARATDPPVLVSELGSGSGRKVRWLLESLARQHTTTYCPIDISAQAISQCAGELGDLKNVNTRGIVGDYLSGLKKASRNRPPDGRIVVLFVGSSIGNYELHQATRLFAGIRDTLEPGDHLLLGTDLVKDEQRMVAAYNDALGVTAAFTRNLLVRLNRELGADFDVTTFRHEARWVAEASRMEMHLVSQTVQSVRIEAADLQITFQKGESIWTESSHKFQLDEIDEWGRLSGFKRVGQWVDKEWPFAETLFEAQ
jgi:dimethylhistidine N-methyltransferase